ncbi:MAG: hypothetical protein QM589_17785 [Thermomicrobiales bacterium]
MIDRTITWFRTFPPALKAITLWALVAGLASIGMNLSAALDGEVHGYTRIGLGIVGVLGSLAILSGRERYTTGMALLIGWSLLQLPFVSSQVDGNLTKQLVDGLLGVSRSVTVNGVVTEYSATGLNMVGILATIVAFAAKRNEGFIHRTEPAPPVNP